MVLRLRSHRGSAFLRRDAQSTVTQFTRTTALRALAAGAALLALAACSSKPDRVENAAVCPAIRVPDEAGEITRFRPGGAIDLTDVAFQARLTGPGLACHGAEGAIGRAAGRERGCQYGAAWVV